MSTVGPTGKAGAFLARDHVTTLRTNQNWVIIHGTLQTSQSNTGVR